MSKNTCDCETCNVPDYLIDAGTSRFTVRAFASGLLSGLGHNPVVAIRGFNGEAYWDPDAPTDGYLRLVILAASLAVQNDVSDKDRREMERGMQNEILEIVRYPEIAFESTGISVLRDNGAVQVRIDGKLTLHGITRPQSLAAQIAPIGDTLRASGEFALRQTDYHIKLASMAAGALKLKDELKFTFDIVARRRSE
jgi:polyisoprenoid-binding protein YceI